MPLFAGGKEDPLSWWEGRRARLSRTRGATKSRREWVMGSGPVVPPLPHTLVDFVSRDACVRVAPLMQKT